MGGAGTGAGGPPLEPVLPLDEPEDDPLLEDEDEVEDELLVLPEDDPPVLEDVAPDEPFEPELLLDPFDDQPPDEPQPPLDDQPWLLDP
jgi:hypothetical protein